MALLALSLALSPASAQEAPDPLGEDPFDAAAFESLVGEAAAPGGSEAPSLLAGGALLLRARSAFPAALDGYAGSSSLSARLFAKASLPEYGAFYAAFILDYPFSAGRTGAWPSVPAPPLSPLEPSFELSELHYSFDLGKVLFLRLGKQLLAWGPSRIWSPVDFVNLEREAGLEAIDLRVGKPGLRLHLPLPKANAFLFADFSGSLEGGEAASPAESLAFGARLDATAGGFELGLTGWAGASTRDKLGLDFSGRLLGASLYGEAAWTPAWDGGGAALAASLGGSRVLGDLRRLTFSAELAFDSEGGDYRGDPAAMAALRPLGMARHYAWASLQARDFPASGLDASLSGLANLSDGSFSLELKEALDLPGLPPFGLSLAWKGGSEGGELTLPLGRDYLSLGLELRAEF